MASIVAVVSDLHANSTVGLCPPRVPLDDGGSYQPSKAQLWLWDKWLDYWQHVKKLRRKRGIKLYCVFNGDLIDGDHHNTPQIISRNLTTQHEIALAVLEPALDCKPDYLFIVRGTEVHTGKSSQDEEALARDIEAVPDELSGTASWWWLPLMVEGVHFDIAHHGRTGYRPWTRANATQMMAAELTMRYAERGEKIPNIAIRSHRHTPADSYDNFPVRVLQTPGWQLSTAFSHRIAPGQLLPVGGYIFTCKEGSYTLDKQLYRPRTRNPWQR